MLFETIEKEYEGDYIILKGLYASTLLNDIYRIYKFNIDPREPHKIKLFFKVIINGVIFQKVTLKFHKFFALEMYYIFDKLYDITQRTVYKDACDALKDEHTVSKYFTPIMPLPAEIESRLDNLSVKLFPFQKHFMESYYNARNKLGMDGMILSYDAGLGKTFTAIAAVYAFQMMPAIITAPRSTLDGWKNSIVRMIPHIKPEEVKISYEYNPSKDPVKWKFFICNYERLEQALEYSKYAVKKPIALLCDESHNFRNLQTNRTKALLNLKRTLDIHNIIAISATPIKSLGGELTAILELLDPEFTEEAAHTFRKIYSRNSYDPITGSILRDRLSIYLERRKQEESIKLPPLEKYTVEVKLNNPQPYLLDQIKVDIWKYVNEHLPEYREQVRPNFEKVEQMMKNPTITSNFDKEKINDYISLVKLKMRNPFDERAIKEGYKIKEFELDDVRKIDSQFAKELIAARRKCTSYMQILLGKAIGIYFVHGKINLITEMVKENIDEIAKIINSGELKTVIFSSFIEPLYAVKEALEKVGIGCILHTGQSDIRETRKQFQEDNTKRVFLGSIAAVGTGTDGLQFCANQIIMLNQPYRSVDQTQVNARLHRKGTPAKVVKLFIMKLNTGEEKNILDSEDEINRWSRAMYSLAVE